MHRRFFQSGRLVIPVGTNGYSTTLQLDGDWDTAGQSWDYSGSTDTGTSLDTGQWGMTANGNYTHTTTGDTGGSTVTGTKGVTSGTTWNSSQAWAAALGDDGSWTLGSASGNWTGSVSQNGWYSGSGTYSNSDDDFVPTGIDSYTDDFDASNGTINEHETSLSSVTYSLNGTWNNGSWTYAGNETGTNSDIGHVGVGGAGTYGNTTDDGQGDGETVTGTTNVNDSTDWAGDSTVTLNPNATGSFTMSSGTGNYTGTVNNVWSYGGKGPVSDTNANNEDLNGSISEGEANTFSVSYSIAANWASNAWQYSGNATGVSLDAGQWTSSATGTYQNDETDSQGNTVAVDGTMGVTSIVNWGYNGTVTLNPNATGSLTMTTGGGNWTGDSQADWSYSGSGSYNDDDTASTISEGENNSNETTYSIQATWNPAGQKYAYSGNQTQTSLDSGSWANTIDGDYAGSDNGVSTTGTSDLTNSVSWSSSTTTNQIFDPSSTATGGWDTTLTTSDNNLQTLSSTYTSGSGAISYYPSINDTNPLGPDTPITGTASDDNGNTLSSSYTWQANGTAGTDGSLTYVYSGNGTALSLTYDDFNYSDSGSYALSGSSIDGVGDNNTYTTYANYTSSGSADTSYNVTTAWNLDPTAGTWTANGTTVDAGGEQTGSYDFSTGGDSTGAGGADSSNASGDTNESFSYSYHLSATQGPDGSWDGTLTGDGNAQGEATRNLQSQYSTPCVGNNSLQSNDQYTYSDSNWSQTVNADGSLGTVSGNPSDDTTGSYVFNRDIYPGSQTCCYANTYDPSNSAGCCTVWMGSGDSGSTVCYSSSDGPSFDYAANGMLGLSGQQVGYGGMVSNNGTWGQGITVPTLGLSGRQSAATAGVGGATVDGGIVRPMDDPTPTPVGNPPAPDGPDPLDGYNEYRDPSDVLPSPGSLTPEQLTELINEVNGGDQNARIKAALQIMAALRFGNNDNAKMVSMALRVKLAQDLAQAGLQIPTTSDALELVHKVGDALGDCAKGGSGEWTGVVPKHDENLPEALNNLKLAFDSFSLTVQNIQNAAGQIGTVSKVAGDLAKLVGSLANSGDDPLEALTAEAAALQMVAEMPGLDQFPPMKDILHLYANALDKCAAAIKALCTQEGGLNLNLLIQERQNGYAYTFNPNAPFSVEWAKQILNKAAKDPSKLPADIQQYLVHDYVP